MPKDGGAAFPVLDPNGSFWNPGMTLRDYFAGQVIARYVQTSELPLTQEMVDECAAHAYSIADAMLAAREAKP